MTSTLPLSPWTSWVTARKLARPWNSHGSRRVTRKIDPRTQFPHAFPLNPRRSLNNQAPEPLNPTPAAVLKPSTPTRQRPTAQQNKSLNSRPQFSECEIRDKCMLSQLRSSHIRPESLAKRIHKFKESCEP